MTANINVDNADNTIIAGRDVVINQLPNKSGSVENIDHLVGSLRMQLCDAVKSRTSHDFYYVPLQIVQYKESDGEVFGKSFDMKHRVETQSPTSVEYDAELLFNEAEKQGKHFLGVIGEPGVGKTSLIINILTHLSTQNFPLVFYIRIRNIDFSSEQTTFRLLIKELLPDWNTDKDTEDALIKTIHQLHDVYILIDGLDEAKNGLFSSTSKAISLFEITTADKILKNMFEDRIFKNAKKLVTSRPDAFLNLHPKCKPAFKVQVLGLGEKSQKIFSIQICDNNVETYAKVQAKLEMNPDLAALCYIPLYCKIIVEQLKISPESASLTHVTSTHIFIQTLCEYIKSKDEHLRGDKDALLKVMELALNGIAENKFIFALDDYPDNERHLFTNFLSVKTDSSAEHKILDGSKQLFFVHLLWQELFAAIKLMLFSDENQFKEYLVKMCEDDWKLVVHFLYGLLNSSSQKQLAQTFKFRSELLPVKLKLLKSLVRQSVVTDGEFDPRNNLVLPCSWAFEANQEIITKEVISLLPEILKLPHHIQSKDAVAISYVLNYKTLSQRIFNIEMIEARTFHGKSLKLLLDAANNNSHRFNEINIKETTLGPEEITCVAKHIDRIKMDNCTFEGSSFLRLCQEIQNCHGKVEEGAVISDFIALRRGISPNMQQTSCPDLGNIQNMSINSTSKSLMELPSLLQEYKSCLATRKFDEAEKLNKEINYFITNEINTTGWELMSFADDLLNNADRFEESIPVWFAAASLCKKKGDLVGMSLCVGVQWGGMHRANKSMIDRDVTMKEVVKRHVIPLMLDIKNQMLEVTPESEGRKCERLSRVLKYIAKSEKCVDDDEAAQEALKESRVWWERLRLEEERVKPWWEMVRDVLCCNKQEQSESSEESENVVELD